MSNTRMQIRRQRNNHTSSINSILMPTGVTDRHKFEREKKGLFLIVAELYQSCITSS